MTFGSRPGLKVNLQDMFGATALMYACKHETGEDVVSLLLTRRDVDLDTSDNDDKTAEDYARIAGHQHIVKIIRYGIHI